MVVLSDCIECEHFCDDGNPHTCCCKAYPDGIPRKWYFEGRPREVKQCNNGIGFKPECNEDLGMAETINPPKLGKLEYLEVPEKIHCWHGELEGSELGFDIILETSKLDQADEDFIAKITKNWKAYEEKALADLREKLISEPKLFGLSKEDAERLSKQNSLPLAVHSLLSMKNGNGQLYFLKMKWA